jgi:hypothetical protein
MVKNMGRKTKNASKVIKTLFASFIIKEMCLTDRRKSMLCAKVCQPRCKQFHAVTYLPNITHPAPVVK